MDTADFRPGVFYFRKALRESASREDAIKIGMVVVGELEKTRQWLWENNLPIPKWYVMAEEANVNGWVGSRGNHPKEFVS